MSLTECISTHTHRQLLLWNEWLNHIFLNRPSRSDYYSMSVAREIRRTVITNQNIGLDEFLLSNNTPQKSTNDPNYLEEQKAIWRSLIGKTKRK